MICRLGFSVCLLSSMFAASAVTAVAEDAPPTMDVKVKDITLKVPKTWKQEEPSNNLRLAQFVLPKAKDDKEDTTLVISAFPGGGGIEQNLPRWVGEFSPEGRSVKMTSGKCMQGDYVVVDLKGTHLGSSFARRKTPLEDARMLSVLLKTEDNSYFLKLVGSEAAVAAQAEALRTAIGAKLKDEKEYKIEK